VSLFTELKRRNVFRVGIAYAIVGWLILQVADLVLNNTNAPDWVMQVFMLAIAVGFPLVLVFAWVFELTPEGLKRDAEVVPAQSIARQTARKLDRAIIIMLVLALAYFVWESRFATRNEPIPATAPGVVEPPAVAEKAKNEAPTTGASVAVLPFMNMSSDQEQEYFSDGITEEVINALVKIPGLSVPARTSVFAYKGHMQDVREIGRELNVEHVLEGSIRSQGKQVRITAQLINVESGYHLWSETFDRQLENIFAVQEEIAGAIAKVLVGELGVEVAAVPNQTRNMEAYDLYLQGRAALRNRDASAIALFEAVTQKDPNFVSGWAALAMAHNSIFDEDEAAIEAADKALSMDPENVDALNAMAAALRGLNRWAEAESYFHRALAIDPGSAELLEDWAEFLNYVGRTDEALEVTTRGIAIEPGLRPLQQEHASALLAAGRIEDARRVAEQITEDYGRPGWISMLPIWQTPMRPGLPVEVPPKPPLPDGMEVPPDLEEIDALMQPSLLSAPSEDWGLQLRFLVEQQLLGEYYWGFPWMARIALIRAGQLEFVIDQYFDANPALKRFAFEGLWTPVMKPVRQHPRFPEFLQSTGMVPYWDATSWPKWCQREAGGVIRCE